MAADRNKRSSRKPDGREVHTYLTQDVQAGGTLQFPHKAGAVVSAVMPVRLEDNRVVYFPAPQFVAFYLVESKRHLDRGEKLRVKVLSQVRSTQAGVLSLTNASLALDCFAELSAAVLLAYAAVESLANAIIERAPESIRFPHVNAKGEQVELDKSEIVRRLSTSEKLDKIVPTLTGRPSVKGTIYWQNFVRLRRIRDALVHVKQSGYSNDPDNPSEYGLLLRGDAKTCTLDAIAMVEELQPDLLSDRARQKLGTLIRSSD